MGIYYANGINKTVINLYKNFQYFEKKNLNIVLFIMNVNIEALHAFQIAMYFSQKLKIYWCSKLRKN